MGWRPPKTFASMISGLSLTAPTLILDAGDPSSFVDGQTTWNDVSGNGYHFLRGLTSSSGYEDPMFNGNAIGKYSRDEYFRCNDDQSSLTTGFAYNSGSNAAWMDGLHKAGAVFTIVAWLNTPWYKSPSAQNNAALCGTNGAGSVTGFSIHTASPAINAGGSLMVKLIVTNASSVVLNVINPTVTIFTMKDEWTFVGLSYTESTGIASWVGNYTSQTSTVGRQILLG